MKINLKIKSMGNKFILVNFKNLLVEQKYKGLLSHD